MFLIADTPLVQWAIIPLLIFFARIIDVTIGTVRIMLVARGIRNIAALFAFFEILIWLVTIRQVMSNLSNVVHYFAYAGGFATGTFVGMIIENKLSFGFVLVRVITSQGGEALAQFLRREGYRLTDLDACGSDGPVRILFLVINRKNLVEIEGIIKKFNPNAFYTIEDVRFMRQAGRPPLTVITDNRRTERQRLLLRWRRKGK
jgi:uncharacterized protein YebE (UPF0316 family)